MPTDRSRSISRERAGDAQVIRSASSTDAELSVLRAQQRADRDSRSVGRRLQKHQLETAASLDAMQCQMQMMTAMMSKMQTSLDRISPEQGSALDECRLVHAYQLLHFRP